MFAWKTVERLYEFIQVLMVRSKTFKLLNIQHIFIFVQTTETKTNEHLQNQIENYLQQVFKKSSASRGVGCRMSVNWVILQLREAKLQNIELSIVSELTNRKDYAENIIFNQ